MVLMIYQTDSLVNLHLLKDKVIEVSETSKEIYQCDRQFFSSLRLTIILIIFFLGIHIPGNLCAVDSVDINKQANDSDLVELVSDEIISSPSLLRTNNTELEIKLIAMKKDLSRLSIASELSAQLEEVINSSDNLNQRLRNIKTNPEINRHQLTLLQVEIENRIIRITSFLIDVNSLIIEVEPWKTYWYEQEQTFLRLQNELDTKKIPLRIIGLMSGFEAIIEEARSTLRNKLEPLFQIQQKAETLQIELHHLDYAVFQELEKKSLVNSLNSPIYSAAFGQQLNKDLWPQTLESLKLALHPDIKDLQDYKLQVLLSVAIFLLLISSIGRVRQVIEKTSKWYFLVQRRYSLAVLLSLTIFTIISREIGTFWLLLSAVVSLLCLWRLSEVILTEDYRRVFVRYLLVILLLTDLFIWISLPIILERLFVVSVSVCLICVAFYHNKSVKLAQYRKKWLEWFFNLTAFIMALVIITEFSGRSELAYFLFASSLRTLFVLLAAWIIYICLSSLIEMYLCQARFSSLNRYAGEVYKLTHPLIIAIIIFALALTILVIWRVYPTSITALDTIEKIKINIGSVTISFSLVFQAMLFLYFSFCASKAVEVILLENVLPGGQLDRGVQLSIARLMNYLVVLVGFIGALMIAGIDMTNITILGGAVGVGIGFGLQAIFNNFISGVILLFERPLKIGDVIMVDNEFGEVKELGLRATVVETLDHAEIVVPNSTLITTNVKNWTLGRRQVRIKVPIGVAYGSDVDEVSSIIANCAKEHPRVLSQPEPIALFIAHGASSLDFELRAFVPDVDDRMSTISDLNQAINLALEEAGINIPFPQRDLHIRTISAENYKAISDSDHCKPGQPK